MNQDIAWATVPCRLQAHVRLDLIKQRFKDAPFAQQQLVRHGQQIVLHSAANAGDQMESVLPAAHQERLGQIALISKHLPVQCSTQGLKRLAGIGAAVDNPEGHKLAFVVDKQMKLEANNLVLSAKK